VLHTHNRLEVVQKPQFHTPLYTSLSLEIPYITIQPREAGLIPNQTEELWRQIWWLCNQPFWGEADVWLLMLLLLHEVGRKSVENPSTTLLTIKQEVARWPRGRNIGTSGGPGSPRLRLSNEARPLCRRNHFRVYWAGTVLLVETSPLSKSHLPTPPTFPVPCATPRNSIGIGIKTNPNRTEC